MEPDREDIPNELKGVDQELLQSYIQRVFRKRLRDALDSEPELKGAVKARIEERLTPAGVATSPSPHQQPTHYGLAFNHDCTTLRPCRDKEGSCELCRNCTELECDSATLKRAYEDEILTTCCEARDLWVELLPRSDGTLPDNPGALAVEFALLDSVEYEDKRPIEECMRVSCQGRNLLGSKIQNPGHTELIKVPFRYDEQRERYIARFPELYVSRNTKHVRHKLGLPHRKEPHFRLMARCIDLQEHDAPHPDFPELISKPFRVVVEKAGMGNKGNPTLDDPVNVLPGIGSETHAKLLDIRTTAAKKNMPLPFESIVTVGDMQRLLGWCRQSSQSESLRGLLNIPRPIWNDFGTVANNARDNDNKVRIWYTADLQRGLMLSCQGGIVQISTPLAIVTAVKDCESGTMVAEELPSSLRDLQADERRYHVVKELIKEAKACWEAAGHPNWVKWEVRTSELRNTWQVPADHCNAPVPMYPGTGAYGVSRISNMAIRINRRSAVPGSAAEPARRPGIEPEHSSESRQRQPDNPMSMGARPNENHMVVGPPEGHMVVGVRPPDSHMAVGARPPDNHMAVGGRPPDSHMTVGGRPPDSHMAVGGRPPDSHMAVGARPPDNHMAVGGRPPDSHVAVGGRPPDSHMAVGGRPPDSHMAVGGRPPESHMAVGGRQSEGHMAAPLSPFDMALTRGLFMSPNAPGPLQEHAPLSPGQEVYGRQEQDSGRFRLRHIISSPALAYGGTGAGIPTPMERPSRSLSLQTQNTSWAEPPSHPPHMPQHMPPHMAQLGPPQHGPPAVQRYMHDPQMEEAMLGHMIPDPQSIPQSSMGPSSHNARAYYPPTMHHELPDPNSYEALINTTGYDEGLGPHGGCIGPNNGGDGRSM
eukprot:jgi/Botrbrau1/13888/Bobra.0056s0119.2